MILKHYYRLLKLPGDKSKQAMDCPESTHDYQPFEQYRNEKQHRRRGERAFYFKICPDSYINPQSVGLAMACRNNHISKIEIPDTNQPYWVGDVQGTSDMILILVKKFERIDGRILPDCELEIFIAPGKSSEKNAIYNLACDGELALEMELLRASIREEK